MDGGTDYANNYFDNGEEEDEDDNLDEGGVFQAAQPRAMQQLLG